MKANRHIESRNSQIIKLKAGVIRSKGGFTKFGARAVWLGYADQILVRLLHPVVVFDPHTPNSGRSGALISSLWIHVGL